MFRVDRIAVILAILSITAGLLAACTSKPAYRDPLANSGRALPKRQAAIDLTHASAALIPIAIPDFVGADPASATLGQSLTRVIVNDLGNSGQLRPIARDAFLQTTVAGAPGSAPAPPEFQNWATIGAQALVTGQATVSGSTITVDFRLWNVLTRTQLVGTEYRSRKTLWRRIGHIIADKIRYQLLSETTPGIATRSQAVPVSVAASLPASPAAAALRPLPSAPDRVALVIGNASYRYVPALRNTTNDARLVARTLRQLGFRLVGGGAQINLDRHQFLVDISTFGHMLGVGSVAVFYYAGHGLQVRGHNYLVPIDANPERASDAEIQMVDANMILDQMQDSGARLKIVMLDACRNNPFGGSGLRGVGGGLAQMAAPEGTLISYATAPGHVAADGPPGGDGPYARALTQAMGQPHVGILKMFNNVAVAVDSTTGHEQQPWLALSPISGNFYFDGQ
ncbi:MAG: caspase family protein [Rhodospirillales bacterium]|nr:caspase family protein [Rhodospirillales bacterium]